VEWTALKSYKYLQKNHIYDEISMKMEEGYENLKYISVDIKKHLDKFIIISTRKDGVYTVILPVIHC